MGTHVWWAGPARQSTEFRAVLNIQHVALRSTFEWDCGNTVQEGSYKKEM